MPIIKVLLKPGKTGVRVGELHNQLLAIGAVIAPGEQTAKKFGPSTVAAVRTFRQNLGLPRLAATVSPFDAAAARLLNVVVPANLTTSAVLSAAVRESLAAAQGATPIEVEWLARYATIARDFTAARQAAALAPTDTVITTVVQPVIGDASFQTPNPELQNPENYYTYRYDFVAQATLDALRSSDGTAAQLFLAPRRPVQQDGPDDWPEVPPDLPDPPPPPPDPAALAELVVFHTSANKWIEAVDFWQKGHREFKAQRYANAVANYDQAQDAAAAYFESIYKINRTGPIAQRIAAITAKLARSESSFPALWAVIHRRRVALTLAELQQIDWNGYSFAASGSDALLRKNLGALTDPDQKPPDGKKPAKDTAVEAVTRQQVLDRFALLLATVFVPLARSEANRMRRFFSDAITDLHRVEVPFSFSNVTSGGGGGGVVLPVSPIPAPVTPAHSALALNVAGRVGPVWLTCDFIERPFVRLAIAETLFERAEIEYKADALADPKLPALPLVANEKPDDSPRQGFEFATHGLRAAQTYRQIFGRFDGVGAYAERVLNGRDELTRGVADPNAPAFRSIGKNVTLPTTGSNMPTVQSTTRSLPGFSRSKAPAESWLQLVPLEDGQIVSETNPRVYSLLLMTQARLEQIKYNFNYLGYPDDYVPPWRFQFLLERARYFAEHAKSAERDYLNFLNNAENEEYQELSASQNVEMEKANVRIETARVDQTQLEVKASNQSLVLSQMAAEDAHQRVSSYKQFSEYADDMLDTASGSDAVGDLSLLEGNVPGLNAALTGVGDIFTGGFFSSRKNELVAHAQRGVELFNLDLAAKEAEQSKKVSQAQLAVAEAGLIVAGLQRQAALLRHEFALQNLSFLRNRQLNSEQWLRLANSIRGISDTYLRYAIQLAFLTEQAYEFEADRRINVIRFDYDLSDVGSFLAADFLLRDLDTIEQDLIVNQQQRQQEVRYVLSMAREFPQALQDLRDNSHVTFSLRLEQIERRFPGLYNARIGAVDVLPVALLDSSRYSAELRHLGSGQLRLKADPDTVSGQGSTSVLNVNDLLIPLDGWLPELVDDWPIKIRVSEPQTNLYSGLSRQDAAAAFPVASSGQRNAFEGLAAASAWEIDMSGRDNAIVPGTLADMLITFTVSGYYDSELRAAIDTAPRNATAATQFLSGQTTFPDALYEFNRSGRMTWNVTRDLLTLTDTLGAVRNVAVLMLPTPGRANYYGRLTSRCEVRVRITSTGDLQVLSEVPQVTFTPGGAANPLLLTARAILPSGAEISWEFGDGSARQAGANQPHIYAKPGRYTVNLRVVRNGRLSEFQAEVVVSRSHAEHLSPPVTAFPTLTVETGAGIPSSHTRVIGTVNAQAGDPVIATWRVGENGSQKGNSATFDLQPGDYTVFFTAVRVLKGCVYSTQRHLSEPVFDFNGLVLTSNRRFDLNGTEITGTGNNPPANPVATHLFTDGALSPVDEWTLELQLPDNPFLRSVSVTDVEQYDLAEIQDAVLALEYETTPGGS